MDLQDVAALEELCTTAAATSGSAWGAVHEIVSALREHSPETYTHSLRVGWYAHTLARLEGSDPGAALLGGFGHDVGKLAVPVDVLCAESFGEAERAKVCVHPEAGYQLLKETCKEAAYVAGLHHTFQVEPYGIDEDELPTDEEERTRILETAHLVSDADFYDALTTRENDRGLVADVNDRTETRKVLLARMSPQRVAALEAADLRDR